jgi:hypothetical protein
MNESRDTVTIIERNGGKRFQAFGTKTFIGDLAGFTMTPPIGDSSSQ